MKRGRISEFGMHEGTVRGVSRVKDPLVVVICSLIHSYNRRAQRRAAEEIRGDYPSPEDIFLSRKKKKKKR